MYPLTFFVKSLGPDTAGEARGPVIRILEKYRHDEGIYQHELMHVMQWAVWSILCLPTAYVLYQLGLFDYLGLAILPCTFHQLLYKIMPAYRFWAEVEAYKVQALSYPDDRRPLFAEFIAGYYDLNITTKQALDALNRK